jgi:hypothetical protein
VAHIGLWLISAYQLAQLSGFRLATYYRGSYRLMAHIGLSARAVERSSARNLLPWLISAYGSYRLIFSLRLTLISVSCSTSTIRNGSSSVTIGRQTNYRDLDRQYREVRKSCDLAGALYITIVFFPYVTQNLIKLAFRNGQSKIGVDFRRHSFCAELRNAARRTSIHECPNSEAASRSKPIFGVAPTTTDFRVASMNKNDLRKIAQHN